MVLSSADSGGSDSGADQNNYPNARVIAARIDPHNRLIEDWHAEVDGARNGDAILIGNHYSSGYALAEESTDIGHEEVTKIAPKLGDLVKLLDQRVVLSRVIRDAGAPGVIDEATREFLRKEEIKVDDFPSLPEALQDIEGRANELSRELHGFGIISVTTSATGIGGPATYSLNPGTGDVC